MSHELWITSIFNRLLAAPANAFLHGIRVPVRDAAHPWTDWLVCEIVVVCVIVALFAFLRSRLSVEKPGRTQHIFEVVYEFVSASAEEIVGHDAHKYVAFFGTIFVFVLFMNLIGLIPGFESPTMYPMVPLGLAVVTFLFYNIAGFAKSGPAYLKHFLGPIWWMAPLMIVIEPLSHLARPLSLTVRLWANMFAGEQVYLTFIQLTRVVFPVVFIGLHMFVAFLQAYIFMLLAMVYVGGAVSEEH